MSLGVTLVNGFLLGIEHEGYPEYDSWLISIYIGPILIMLGRNVDFSDGEE